VLSIVAVNGLALEAAARSDRVTGSPPTVGTGSVAWRRHATPLEQRITTVPDPALAGGFI
jgi:hypothetical protein